MEIGAVHSEHMPLSSGDRSAPVGSRNSAGGVVTAAGQRLARWGKKGQQALSRMKIPFKVPSLIDRTQPYFSGIARFGITGFWNFIYDPFHTMLNMPWRHFILMFFAMYFVEYLLFAFLFYIQGDGCVINMDGKFAHALWMSSRTASTLGFDSIHPNPDCGFVNFCVMFEVVSSSLINFIMLGVVFARFSAPFKRATTVRFSKHAVCHRHPSGYWAISMRVANLRKHQILQPSIRLVVTAVDSITPSNYMFEHLKVDAAAAQETNIELGFPANLVHVISPDSYLYNLSLLEMDTRMMEVLVFVDGIDAMTSKHMSAKFSYSTNDILLNQVHLPLNLEMRGKKLGLDFNDFDKTVPASAALEDELNLRRMAGVDEVGSATAVAAAAGAEATAQVGWQLRHQTFRRLAERYSGTQQPVGPGSTGANGPLSPPGYGAPAAGGPGPHSGTEAGAREGVFEGSYLQYSRKVPAGEEDAEGASGSTGGGADRASAGGRVGDSLGGGPSQGGKPPSAAGAGHVALTIGVQPADGVLPSLGQGSLLSPDAAGGGSVQSTGGYAPLLLHSPAALAPGQARSEGGGVWPGPPLAAGSQAGAGSAGASPAAGAGQGAFAYQPPTAATVLQSSGQGPVGGEAHAHVGHWPAPAPGAGSVVVVSPELAAATPHLWDPSVTGLAPYAAAAAAAGADTSGSDLNGWAQGQALAGVASVGGQLQSAGSGSVGAALPVSSGASEPQPHGAPGTSGNPFTLL